MLGPVIGALIVFAEHIVAQRYCVDVGTWRGQFGVDEPHRLGAQALIVVEKQDPLMGASGQGECPCLLDRWGPGNRDHVIRQAGGAYDGVIGGGLVDENDFVGEGQGAQAGGDDRGPVVRDDEGAEARTLWSNIELSVGNRLIRHTFYFSTEVDVGSAFIISLGRIRFSGNRRRGRSTDR